ncbi:cytochrome and DOMON domain-containing protein [Aspergillus homomorphus CBS 101889]|uniref:CBD9-like protein n=1 Tax=Aspergillus homomorphus (strain CBS 101889) TaxID=1450537 RepID=A0A395HZ64_ASPHC|nr:CBD9-like protein [Aspergillus homomorphus CBS 101889]RAL12826.1 CBD9-like protein [Aspergillus homomorphus CBS 101889]
MRTIRLLQTLLGLATTAPLTTANIVSFSPSSSHPDLTYSITVPETTTQENAGPIYLQIRAPATMQWVALGQGTRMAGSNIFVVYAASSTELTLSPRLGLGHIEPEYTQLAHASLLPSSNITDGIMTANIACTNCLSSWSSPSETTYAPDSSSAPFIWAYHSGDSLNTTSVTSPIVIHTEMGSTTVDLRAAQFSAPSTTTTTTTNNTDFNPFALPSTNSTTTTTTTTTPQPSSASKTHSLLITHAVMMSLAFTLLYPLAALPIPLGLTYNIPKTHAPLQLFTTILTLVGLGTGVYLADETATFKHAHPIIGIILVGVLVLFQPLAGYLQHRHWKREAAKSVFGYMHRWVGRGAIVLGMVNGGLGFWFAGGVGSPKVSVAGVVVYSVVAGVVFLGLFDGGVHVPRAGKGKGWEFD